MLDDNDDELAFFRRKATAVDFFSGLLLVMTIAAVSFDTEKFVTIATQRRSRRKKQIWKHHTVLDWTGLDWSAVVLGSDDGLRN